MRYAHHKKFKEWCRRGESNPRPRDYETLALPLSYAGMRQFFMLRIRLRRCQGVVSADALHTFNQDTILLNRNRDCGLVAFFSEILRES